ncbi:MAG: YncE family protein [Ferruginibacter sp.]
MNYKKISIIGAMLMLAATPKMQAQSGLHLANTFSIKSNGGWDYLITGPVNDWLYVSHGTQVNILNKNTGDSVGIIENTTGVHGIAFDVAEGKGYTSNGRLNNVFVFDLQTNKVLGEIATGQNPDAIIYETFSKKIITCNGRSHNLSIIDPIQGVVVDSVDVGGKPETAVSNGMGLLYVNVEDKNEIAVVDTKTFKVLHHWSIAPGEGPTGLAFDAATHRLFAGCEKLLMVINADNGAIVDKITIGDGCDGVAFDASTKNIYTANGADATLTVIKEVAADKYQVLENIETKKGARTITLDAASHKLYLPTADMLPMEPGQKGRPKLKPGTFQVLVYSN